MYAARHARDRPGDPAIIMGSSGEVVSFAGYEGAANQMAHLLRDAGLRRGDHVAIFMRNEPAMLICEAAAERCGLYYTCVDSHLSAGEAAYIVNDSGSRLVVAGGDLRDSVSELPACCPGVERWLLVGHTGASAGRFEDWRSAIASYPTTPVGDEELGSAMLYSSGTTGRPKGIIRPLSDARPSDDLPVTSGLAALWRFREKMVYLSPAPLYHAAPHAGVALALRLGAKVVVMERFDPSRFLELVEEHSVTHTQMVPTMFSRLLKLPPEHRERTVLSSLEVVVHAAAPCPVPLKEQMIEWFGPILLEYYAATEANGFTLCDSHEWLSHKGTVGRAVVGELLICDEDGRRCGAGETGTVWFRGATNFEYWNDPAATAASRDETGDASTVGDIGHVDEDGYLYLTDRKHHMIISGGVNVYPQETENLLLSHPRVLDAAVFSVPDEDLGEVVKAVVQVTPGTQSSPELETELIAFCRSQLAHVKCPRSVDFEAELPRSETGKLYKRLLRDRYR